MLGILGSSLMPAQHEARNVVKESIHNGPHIPAYMGLTFLLVKMFQSYQVKAKIIIWIFLISALWGWINEIVQNYVPGRDCSVTDEIFNIIGTIAALILIKRLNIIREIF